MLRVVKIFYKKICINKKKLNSREKKKNDDSDEIFCIETLLVLY